MIRNFLIERLSWILLFISLQILSLFIAYIDVTIPLGSMLYVSFLSLVFFSIFLVIRYYRETRFYRSLEDWESSLDLSEVAEPASPFETIVERSLTEQTSLLKQELSVNRIHLEQEKDDLLSWIHEVKTPLTAMQLMIGRIENGSLKAQLNHEWLRIHLLLDQQLHQKRLEVIENDLYIEHIDLESIVFNEIKTVQSWCIQKGIGFDIQLGTTDVLSDAKWLSFIIRQLLTNAIKYSQATDILIRSYNKEGQFCLEVNDTGRGIDPKDLPRIFDKGFTSTANHREQASTGIGLYLAKKAALPLFIKIDVRSILGQGTTATLYFPKQNEFVNLQGM
ncbi:sensor histidine kinase [Paenisporosarcina sp. OV554]|uniref:sensor histidine kinase n=1 Tax=Paenisporosarcina sp. OV554 TaxID=2135694 RepID=UPI000D37B422|nr:sensor histidine kinase [Paenisporosarcina sp. OV554]PUB09936.1 two-component system, OmpR family, bacitracin resistance sensor histidine kinase BceS [Paenisporosarcina sp. OV554]